MKAVGIIAEYNPFHNGHWHHLQEAMRGSGADASVCVMSGNFTQRGEAALLDKWKRAEIAVRCGIDLVIELPFVFAVRSAQDFARGGVRLLSCLPAVKSLAFGSETADPALLHRISETALASETAALLQKQLKTGQSYAAALATAISSHSRIPASILKEPNTILSVEYLNAIKIFHSPLQPLPIERRLSRHSDTAIKASLASAKAVRQELQQNGSSPLVRSALPSAAYECLRCWHKDGFTLPSLENLTGALLTKLRQADYRHTSELLGISEGLEHKLINAALAAQSTGDLLARIKSRRYPQSRLQRLLLYTLLDFTKAEAAVFDKEGPLYARVLGASRKGCDLLRQMKEEASIPFITKTTAELDTFARARGNLTIRQQQLAYDTYASDIYALCFPVPQAGAQDFTTPPFIAGRTFR